MTAKEEEIYKWLVANADTEKISVTFTPREIAGLINLLIQTSNTTFWTKELHAIFAKCRVAGAKRFMETQDWPDVLSEDEISED